MRRLLLAAAASVALLCPRAASAAGSFVDAPLTLPPLKFSADAGIGFGTFQAVTLSSNLTPSFGGTQVGWGTNLEAAVGLPFVGQLGVRIGYRFGSDGVAAGNGFGADHYARLFDPIVSAPGGSNFANPEISLRGQLFDLQVLQMGLETRLIVPTDNTVDPATGERVSSFTFTPGVPFRVHTAGFLRVDTGLYLPLTFVNGNTGYTLDIPAQAFFQVGSAFFGPVTGLRFNSPGGGAGSSTDIPLGVAAGYTVVSGVDVKIQLRTERINDPNWAAQYLGGGLGVGLRLP